MAKGPANRESIDAPSKAAKGSAHLSEPALNQAEVAILDRQNQCDWRTYDDDVAFLRAQSGRGHSIRQPVITMLATDSPVEIAAGARLYSAGRFPARAPMATGAYSGHDRIRVGYLTGEAFDHPVGNLLAGIAAHHDREKYELYAFSHGEPVRDAVRARIEKNFDHFIQLGRLDDEAIARIIRGCEIDVLAYLSGLTQYGKQGVLAHRPAPVQVNYLGFPGTMGAPYVDYLVADRHVIPTGAEQHYDEQIVRMPNSYLAADDASPISPRLPSRSEEGLPDGAVVFMAYFVVNKITPDTFACWMRILKRVEGSVLWLAQGYEHTAANLRREAAAHGIDPGRLVFASRLDERAEHLARHRLADLFLDNFRYNAHSTASDALWAGLPVITRRGESFPARVCAGLLTEAGLGELITETDAEYEDLAVALATDPKRMAALRKRVEREVGDSPLFDTARYAAHLESGFSAMVERSRAGLPPVAFAIESLPPSGRMRPPRPWEGTETSRVDILVEIGRAHWTAKKLDAAEAAFNEVRGIDPANAAALEGLGLIARNRGNPPLARALLAQAVEANPSLAEASMNLAVFLEASGLAGPAQALLERVIAEHPGYAVAYSTLAQLLWRRGAYRDAYEAFEKATELDPEHSRFVDAWSYERFGDCDWSGYDVQVEALQSLVRAGRDVAQPFVMMLMSDDAALLQQSARAYARKRYPPKPAVWTVERRNHARIKLGYLTAEIYDHPVANLLAGVWERHDREAFDVTCYSYGPPTDHEVQHRLKTAFDRFVDVSALNDEAAARLIHADEIDIALTVNGYTQNARPGILAWRPAPIQVNYVGFAGTMGVPYVDYLIGDPHVVGLADYPFTDEKVVRLPDLYLPADDRQPQVQTNVSRAEAGLPRGAFVFAAFNHSYKITPDLFSAWMRILKRVPNSVLWLPDKDALMRENLGRQAAAQGVRPDRLIFAGRTRDRAGHLARLRLADLFLDTAPYSAHATAIDALWAGLPVVTLTGRAFPARVCAGVLTVAGAPELVAATLEAYESLAVSLAKNPGKLALVRNKIRREALRSPLFDTARHTRHLEAALKTMYEIHQAGETPRAFDVEAIA